MSELMLLFATALVAATLLPVQSELVLAGLYLGGAHHWLTLLLVATAGNVLGAVINWLLGRYLVHFQDRRWFPVNGKHMERAARHYRKWGVWSLLLAWVPFIGDPLTVIAGVFRTPFRVFVLLVTIGKAGRYAFLLAALIQGGA
ncbi:MAG: DedA family protein [Hyphomicrobiales bacterium]|nr:DedA family protein [Hyphomicrobiales bacterium]